MRTTHSPPKWYIYIEKRIQHYNEETKEEEEVEKDHQQVFTCWLTNIRTKSNEHRMCTVYAYTEYIFIYARNIHHTY